VTNQPPLLSVDRLLAGYATPVVGPVSFVIGRGEIVALAGANGSGKTTILSAVIGTARVLGGRLACDRSVGVSVLRQFPVRLPEMPLLGSDFLGITGAPVATAPPMLRPLLDLRVDRLSGGQFQLLMVWACLGSAAGLIMLDEPTNNMDPGVIASFADLLLEARGRGKAVLVISHEARLLERACTRVVEIGQ
jgi:ABC-2 type transport system ATP-binding protein